MKKRQATRCWRLSHKAAGEVEEIGSYTEAMWGVTQRDRYLDRIEGYFNKLVKNPRLGHDVAYIRSGYRRKNIGEHCVFYQIIGSGDIMITRVLHQNRDIVRHILEDESE